MQDLAEFMFSVQREGAALNGWFGLVALCCVRFYAAMLVLPATSDQQIRGVTRNGLALVAGLFVAASLPADALKDVTVPQFSILALKEGLIGTLLGFAASTVFWIADGVGAMIDNQAGFNSAQLMNPTSGEQSTPMSNTIGHLAIAAFYVLGGMQGLMAALFESYRWWPLTEAMPAWNRVLEDFVSQGVSRYIAMVLKVAAPVMLVLLMIDLGIGLLAKAADKLEPNNLASPIKGAVTYLMLSILIVIFFDAARPDLAMTSLAHDLRQWTGQSMK